MKKKKYYKAVAVAPPFAQQLVRGEGKEIIFSHQKVKYRGDVLVCATRPEWDRFEGVGQIVGIVELYDIIPADALAEDEWKKVARPNGFRSKTGYAWFVRNPRTVVEMPMKCVSGFFNIPEDAVELTEYPKVLQVGPDGWELIKKKIKR